MGRNGLVWPTGCGAGPGAEPQTGVQFGALQVLGTIFVQRSIQKQCAVRLFGSCQRGRSGKTSAMDSNASATSTMRRFWFIAI